MAAEQQGAGEDVSRAHAPEPFRVTHQFAPAGGVRVGVLGQVVVRYEAERDVVVFLVHGCQQVLTATDRPHCAAQCRIALAQPALRVDRGRETVPLTGEGDPVVAVVEQARPAAGCVRR